MRILKGTITGLIIALLNISAYSQLWVPIDGHQEPDKPQITVISSNEQATVLHVKLKGFFVQDILIDGTIYHQLSIPGYSTTQTVGKPALPVINEMVGIPGNKNTTITITNASEIELTGYNVYPFQTPLLETEIPMGFDIDQFFYSSGDYFPADNASKSDPRIWRNIRNINVMLKPFKNKPANGSLKILKEFDVQINYSGTSTQNVLPSEDRYISKEYEAMYSDLIINYDYLSLNRKEQRDSDDYDYLIISADNYINQLDKFIEHKQNRGFRVKTVSTSTIGNTSDAIKSYILNEYTNHEIEYVLFVGDNEDIPIYLYIHNNSKGDYAYSCLVGDDFQADVAIGRFSVDSNDDLTHIIDKSINYENKPPMDNWLEKSLLIAHKEGAPDKYQACKERVQTAEETDEGTYTIMYPVFDIAYGAHDFQGGNNATNQTIINAINEGRGLVNYRGHGVQAGWRNDWSNQGVAFDYDETISLTNGNRTPVIFSIACETSYIPGDCHAETFTNMEQGAVAYYGASNSTYTISNNFLDEQLYNQALNLGHFNIGNTSNTAQLKTIAAIYDQGVANAKLYFWCGDPSLELWTGIPKYKYMVIDYIENKIRVIDNNEQPIPQSKVSFKQGDDFETGYTDQNGYAICSFDINHLTQITANKHDYLPSYTQILTADEVWNSEKVIRGNVIITENHNLNCTGAITLPKHASLIIKEAGNLTVNSDFTMQENAKIVVEPGGTAIFNPGVNIIALNETKIIVEGSLSLTNQQLDHIDVEIKDGGELIILDEVTFDNASGLILQPGAIVSGTAGVANTLAINGDLNSLNGVTFNNISSGTAGEVVIDNEDPLNITSCHFNSSNLEGHLTFSDVNIEQTNFNSSYVRLDIFTNVTSGLCEVSDNTFENLVGSSTKPMPALRIEDFPLFRIHDNIFRNSTSDGIAVYNSGSLSYPAHSVSNNRIYNNSGKGVIIYSSVADIYDNLIYLNNYGVATYHNSSVRLYGRSTSISQGIYQMIYSNDKYQVLAGEQSFPWYFAYNVINEINSTYPRVYSTDGAPQRLYNIKNNCWGDDFNPQEDIAPLSYYVYLPVWDCGLNPGGPVLPELPEEPRMAYETSLAAIDEENFAEAETQLKTIITTWPESSFAGEAMKTMQTVAIETNTLDDLIAYYNTNSTIQGSEDLAKLGGYLVADCKIIQKEYQDALSHYEEVISDPPTEEDYIYAVIDAGRVQYLMEQEENKAPVNFKYANLIPPTRQAYKENRRLLLDGIKGDENIEDFNESNFAELSTSDENIRVYPNPVLNQATIEMNIGMQTNVTIEVLDISGKLIQQANYPTNLTGKLHYELSTEGIENGVYFIKTSFNNDQRMSKIIIAK